MSKFGVNVWWTCPEVVVDGKGAQDVLVKHGFDKDLMKLPSRRLEVSRCAYSYQNRQGKENRRVTEKANETGVFIKFGILDREQESSSEVSFRQSTTIVLDKESGTVTADGNLAADFLKTLPNFEGKIMDDDIRMFLRHVIRKSFGIAKRPSGGIYFVPAEHSTLIERAQDVLRDLGTSARIYVEEILDCPANREIALDSLEATVTDEIEKVLLRAESIERSCNAVSGQSLKLMELDDLVKLYQGLLGDEDKFDLLKERIKIAREDVEQKMAKIKGDMEPPTPPKTPSGTRKPRCKSSDNRAKDVVDAAVTVLKASGGTMSYAEIGTAARDQGLTEYCDGVFSSELVDSVRKGDARIVRVGRGQYQYAASAVVAA